MTKDEALSMFAESLCVLTENGVVKWRSYPGGRLSDLHAELFLNLTPLDEAERTSLQIMSDPQENDEWKARTEMIGKHVLDLCHTVQQKLALGRNRT